MHCAKSLQSRPTLWTAAHQAPLSMGFSRRECWSGLPRPPPGIFLTQVLNPCLLCLLHWHVNSLPGVPPGTPQVPHICINTQICFSLPDLSPSVWQRSLSKLAGIVLQETQASGFRSWSSHLLALWTWANYSTSLISTSSALQWEWIPCSGGFQGRLQTLRQTSHEDGQWGPLSWSEAVSAGSPSPQKWCPSLQETSAELQSHTCLLGAPSWKGCISQREPRPRGEVVCEFPDVPAQLRLLWAVKPLRSPPDTHIIVKKLPSLFPSRGLTISGLLFNSLIHLNFCL